jgi:hypothetical protein
MKRNTQKDILEYQLRRIPAPLWERFKLACEAQRPPLSMQWAIIASLPTITEHLEKRVGLDPPSPPAAPQTTIAPRVGKPRGRPRKVKPEPIVPAVAASQANAPELPDLGASF